MTTVAEPIATLRVAEVYGRVLQGEGPHAGRPATFIRLMGCNLSCSWCDSRFTWDPPHMEPAALLRPTELLARTATLGAPIVVITGGEPLLQQDTPAWAALLRGIRGQGRDVHLETNGTIEPSPITATAEAIAVSPKGGNAGPHRGHQDPALHPAWIELAGWHAGVFFKLVVETAAEVDAWVWDLTQLGVPKARIWMMPQAATRGQLALRWATILEAAADAGVNATTRGHVLAFDTERGR